MTDFMFMFNDFHVCLLPEIPLVCRSSSVNSVFGGVLLPNCQKTSTSDLSIIGFILLYVSPPKENQVLQWITADTETNVYIVSLWSQSWAQVLLYLHSHVTGCFNGHRDTALHLKEIPGVLLWSKSTIKHCCTKLDVLPPTHLLIWFLPFVFHSLSWWSCISELNVQILFQSSCYRLLQSWFLLQERGRQSLSFQTLLSWQTRGRQEVLCISRARSVQVTMTLHQIVDNTCCTLQCVGF